MKKTTNKRGGALTFTPEDPEFQWTTKPTKNNKKLILSVTHELSGAMARAACTGQCEKDIAKVFEKLTSTHNFQKWVTAKQKEAQTEWNQRRKHEMVVVQGGRKKTHEWKS